MGAEQAVALFYDKEIQAAKNPERFRAAKIEEYTKQYSDSLSLASDATYVQDGDSWIINGTKNFITGGGIADTVIVMARTDKKLGPKGISLFAPDRTTPGFSSADVSFVGGLACNVSNLAFEDCRVPGENLIGNAGKGLKNILIGIQTARLFISAGAVGMVQSCMDACIKYTKERHQFGLELFR